VARLDSFFGAGAVALSPHVPVDPRLLPPRVLPLLLRPRGSEVVEKEVRYLSCSEMEARMVGWDDK
jgi:hypothetical protein